MPKHVDPPQFIRLPQVFEMTGLSTSTISSLGEKTRITILGATTDELSIRQLNDGLGIFASGSLEAIVTDSSWSAAALGNNVFGDASRFW